jgi:hypothetical protein
MVLSRLKYGFSLVRRRCVFYRVYCIYRFPMADKYVIASVSSVINILEFGRSGWGLGFGSCEGVVVMAVGRSDRVHDAIL